MPTVENTPTPIEKPKPPPETKRVYWDKTPAEQGIKVEDWINIEGYTGQMIGAEVIGTGGKQVSTTRPFSALLRILNSQNRKWDIFPIRYIRTI